MSNKKKKKEKIIYIDDGSTISDMSGIGRGKGSERPTRAGRDPGLLRPRASFKEQRDTYFAAVKMMILPMLVTIGIISIAFLILWLAFGG
jgi:hypothetical protein